MTLRERARIATAVRQRIAEERAERLREALERDDCIKRAAHAAGLPYRTACRYRRERIGA
jgi:molybdenum-dependent DNA-binding transcriptional regulator ModE